MSGLSEAERRLLHNCGLTDPDRMAKSTIGWSHQQDRYDAVARIRDDAVAEVTAERDEARAEVAALRAMIERGIADLRAEVEERRAEKRAGDLGMVTADEHVGYTAGLASAADALRAALAGVPSGREDQT